MSDYLQALRTIFQRADFERGERPPYAARNWRLGRVAELLAALGDPHKRYPSVHIAGTKGKGSTTAIVESILRAAGYRTGMYTSPHLHTFRERIRIDGQPISEQEVISLVSRLRPLLAERPEVTVFEIITAMAMRSFCERQVDWGVLEVGLGGRLDATNVLQPAVTAITSISHDHMGVLGNSLAEIAGEKAGIVKPCVPVVSAPQRLQAARVIERISTERGAPLVRVGNDWTWEALETSDLGQTFTLYRRGQAVIEHAFLPLWGEHQLENAAIAVAIIWTLREQGIGISQEAVLEGLAQVSWPGRLELLHSEPAVVVDGAHNRYSIERVLDALSVALPERRLRVVFGASRSHLPDRMLVALRSATDRILLTRAAHPKSTPLEELSATAEALGFEWSTHATVAEALQEGLHESEEQNTLLVIGSLFVMAEARQAWTAIRGLPALPTDPPGAY